MDEWSELQIDYFKSVTNWTNDDTIIDYLSMYEWNLEFAISGLLIHPDEDDQDQSTVPILRRINSKKETGFKFKFINEDYTDQLTTNQNRKLSNRSISQLSDACKLFNPQQTTTVNTSNKNSFLEHVDQLLASNDQTTSPIFQFNNQKQQLIQYIDSNVIGKNLPIDTPWGTRKLIYADYTGCGRGLTFIEQYILINVLPYSVNTDSENNACALQITKFREGARSIIKKCVNATDDDVLIFTGKASSTAINAFIKIFNLKDENIRNNVVVFVSKFEQYSDTLVWKDTGIEIVKIPNDKEGLLNTRVLEGQLEYYYHDIKKHIICVFNAASIITGIRTDVDSISTLVHRFDGWIFWDYTAAAPYVKIDMNSSETAFKDAVFISTNKFVGGPSTPGILIAKKKLFTNKILSNSNANAVNIERVEDRSSNIIGTIRAGLVFHLKESVGIQLIELRIDKLVGKFFKRFQNHKTLIIIGSSTVPRLAIFSFLIYVESIEKCLHHNFISILLNDLFGIQVQLGCSNSGSYVLNSLGTDDKRAEVYTKFIIDDKNGRFNSIPKSPLMKPGFTRFNLSYFASNDEIDYIFNALDFIANEGWKFLPLYTYNPTKAVWYLRDMQTENTFLQFQGIETTTVENEIMEKNLHPNIPQLIITSTSIDPIEQAKSISTNIPKYVNNQTDPVLNIPDGYEDSIWFVTPKEIIQKIQYYSMPILSNS